MPDECRPPEGAEAGTWHWLDWHDDGPYPFQWMHGSWWSARSSMETDWAADSGYRYREPALTPDEAARLAAEVREARAAIRDAAQCRVDSTAITPDWWHERHAAAIALAKEGRP